MDQLIPRLMSLDELRDPEKVSEKCKNSEFPYLIKNGGDGDLILMSADFFKKTYFEYEVAVLLNEALKEADNPDNLKDGLEFLDELDRKYGCLENCETL